MSLVEVAAVRKRFAGMTAVHDLSLRIDSGRFVTLLGPSGCGKTTLLRMIGGLERPDAGRILIDGRDIGSYRGAERPTRMVFQSYALFPHMTVARNIAYGLRLQKIPRHEIDRLVAAQLDLVGLPDKAASYPGELSGGQQQRVALARALVTKPRLLLLDEPLAALDLKLRQRMQAELKQLQRAAGITFLFVTHDQDEALALSDEILVMERGRVAQRGAPADIYNRPRSRFVAGFLGDATVVEARIEAVDGNSCRLATPFGPLVANAAEGDEPGRAVDLAIRPERVKLDGGSINPVAGRLAAITYRGSDAIGELDVSGTRLRFIGPTERIASLQEGETIGVTIPPDVLWTMPRGESA